MSKRSIITTIIIVLTTAETLTITIPVYGLIRTAKGETSPPTKR